MEKEKETTDGFAYCLDCGQHFENPKNVMAVSSKHARAFNHKVQYWVRVDGYYDDRKVKNGNK